MLNKFSYIKIKTLLAVLIATALLSIPLFAQFIPFAFWQENQQGFLWTGLAGDNDWHNSGNWSENVVPSIEDVAIFRVGSCLGANCNADITSDIEVKGIKIENGFIGILTQNIDSTILVGSEGWLQDGGAFVGSNSSIFLDKFELKSGQFTSTSATMFIGKEVSNSNQSEGFIFSGGTFNHGFGSVLIQASNNASSDYTAFRIYAPSGVDFYHLTISIEDKNVTGTFNNAILEIEDFHVIDVLGELTVTNGKIHGGSIHLAGNLVLTCDLSLNYESCAGPGGDAKIVFVNSSPSSYYASNGAYAPHLVINTPSLVLPDIGTTNLNVSKFHLINGDFIAPSEEFKVSFTHLGGQGDHLDGFIVDAGSFNHNMGKVIIDFTSFESTDTVIAKIAVPLSLDFYNLEINASDLDVIGTFNNAIIDASNDSINILGNLILKNGRLNQASINLHGDLNIFCDTPLGFEYCSAGGESNINFVSDKNQNVFIDSGADFLSGSITVNKADNYVVQLSDLSLLGGLQNLNIEVGTWDMGGFDLVVNGDLDIANIPVQAYLLQNCGSLTVNGIINDPGSGLITTCGLSDITISNLILSSASSTEFQAVIDFTGDANYNADLTLKWCNSTKNPGCTPSNNSTMHRSSSKYSLTVSGLSSPNDPGDEISVEIVATDPDGVSGSPLTGTVNLFLRNDIELINLNLVLLKSDSFKATVNYLYDHNLNAKLVMRICNETKVSGCEPAGPVLMNQISNEQYTWTVENIYNDPGIAGLGYDFEPGDTVKVQVTAIDADGEINSPLVGTIVLGDADDLEFLDLSLVSNDFNSFEADLSVFGDLNNNASVSLKYCNETDTPGCAPAFPQNMVKLSNDLYRLKVGNLSSPFDCGDSIRVEVSGVDPNGVTNTPLAKSVILKPCSGIHISNLQLESRAYHSFNVMFDFSGDTDKDAQLAVRWCNLTDNPGCSPTNLLEVKRGFDVYTAQASYLSAPDDIGDTIYVEVTAIDPGGVTGAPLSGTVVISGPEPTLAPGPPQLRKVFDDYAVLRPLTESPRVVFDASGSYYGIANHQAELRDASDHSVVQAWTTFNSGDKLTGLSLLSGENYYIALRSIDNSGNVSAEARTMSFNSITAGNFFGGGLIPSVANYISHVDILDIDKDGDNDIVTTFDAIDYASKPLFIFNNSGGTDPNFAAQYLIDHMVDVKIVDLDNDGDLDIVGFSGSDLIWLDNDGMQPANYTKRVIAAGLSGYKLLAIGDLNKNQHLDLLIRSTANVFTWVKNDGADLPSFTVQTAIEGSLNINSPTYILDLNNDGHNDIVTYHHSSKVRIYLNDEASDPSFIFNYQHEPSAGKFYIADFDLDGDLDLVDLSQTEKVWLENNGSGSFTKHVISEGGYYDYTGVELKDIDGDGYLDIHAGADQYLNRTSSSKNFEVTTGVLVNNIKGYIYKSIDLNNDGSADYIPQNGHGVDSSDLIYYKYNIISGEPDITDYFSIYSLLHGPIFEYADIDKDGDLDFVFGNKFMFTIDKDEGTYDNEGDHEEEEPKDEIIFIV